MDVMVNGSARRLAALLLTLALAACTGAGSSAGGAGSPTTVAASVPAAEPGASIDAGGGGGGTGEATVTGSLVSSGIYDATWKWEPGNAAGPGIGGITVNSDKATFGNIEVLPDGSITFSTGAPEISAGQPFKGTGAQVKMKDQIPCGFTLDNDLTGTDGTVLHMKGEMTLSDGAFQC